MKEVKRLSLGCEPIDEILGGGIEYGVITNFYGEAGAGKSNISLSATVETLKKGKNVLFIDTEGSFSTERAAQMYEDFEEKSENVILMEPSSFEDQHKNIMSIKDLNDEIGLVVVDSMVALYRIVLNGNEQEGANKKLAQQFAELSRISRGSNIPVLITNQVYSNFDSDEIELVSRDVARYWSKCLVKLEKRNENRRMIEIAKHRSRPQGVSAEFTIEEDGLYPMGEDQGESDSIL